MEKVHIICWAKASQDDRGMSVAFSGVYGVYTSVPAAEKGLEACKNEFVKELTQDCDDVAVYGSVAERYFELDFDEDGPCEIYISLETQTIQNI